MEIKKSIAYCKESDIFLDTGLSPEAFAKARLSNKIMEAGTLARAQNSSSRQTAGIVKSPEYTAEEWRFDGTQIEASENGERTTVFFKGKGFSGTTLFEILEENSLSKTSLALFFVCAAIVKTGALVSAVGAGGIFLGESENGNLTGDVLFLPPSIFQNAAEQKSDDVFSALQGCFFNYQLSESESQNYLLAALAYRGITQALPFPSLSSEKRNADNLDNNFEPISLFVNGIDENLSSEIDSRLFFPQKEYSEFPIESLSREMGLEALPQSTDGFVSAARAPVQHKKMTDPAVFERKRKRGQKARTIRAAYRRFLRTRGSSAAILAIVLAGVFFVLASYFRGRSNEITTLGLSAKETAETFYTGLQNSDVIAVHNSATGEADKRFSDSIANIYVTNKARASYDKDADTKPLEEWLFFHNDFKFWIYGMTHFRLDGKTASLDFSAPQKYMKPSPFVAQNGEEKTQTATYFLVLNSGENELTVLENTDLVQMIFKENRWQVRDVKSTGKPVSVDLTAFRADVRSAEEKSAGDVILEADILREKYPWIPEKKGLLSAAKKLSELYSLKSALSALEKYE